MQAWSWIRMLTLSSQSKFLLGQCYQLKARPNQPNFQSVHRKKKIQKSSLTCRVRVGGAKWMLPMIRASYQRQRQRRLPEETSIWHCSGSTRRFLWVTVSRVSRRFTTMCLFTRGLPVFISTVSLKSWSASCSMQTKSRWQSWMWLTRYPSATISWDAALKMSTTWLCRRFTLSWQKPSVRSRGATWLSAPR